MTDLFTEYIIDLKYLGNGHLSTDHLLLSNNNYPRTVGSNHNSLKSYDYTSETHPKPLSSYYIMVLLTFMTTSQILICTSNVHSADIA